MRLFRCSRSTICLRKGGSRVTSHSARPIILDSALRHPFVMNGKVYKDQRILSLKRSNIRVAQGKSSVNNHQDATTTFPSFSSCSLHHLRQTRPSTEREIHSHGMSSFHLLRVLFRICRHQESHHCSCFSSSYSSDSHGGTSTH